MNGKALKEPAKEHLTELKKLASAITQGISESNIHDFRVEVKKLRAYLRLLSSRSGKDKKLKLSNDLKSFYKDLGRIRNLVVTEEQVYKLSVQNVALLPVKYLEALRKGRQDEPASIMVQPVEKLVKKETNRVLKSLPGKLSRRSINRFLKKKEATLSAIILLPHIPDDQLHEVRKILKDIMYNWEYLKHANLNSLPYFLQTHDMLKELTDRLGTHQDLVTAIQILQNDFHEAFAIEGERQIIEALLRELVFYKAILKRPILEKLKIAYS